MQKSIRYTQEHSETQLHTAKHTDTSQQKRWVSLVFFLKTSHMKKIHLSVPFTVLGRIRSTQPTMLGANFFLKLTPIVRLGNRTYRAWGSEDVFFLKLTPMVAPHTRTGNQQPMLQGHLRIGSRNWY